MRDPLRWRPNRAGVRNIWEYDSQVFEFADGRLVLRGPNGSGKSNALALLVPFLLDGVMAASRMDSLSGGRSMKTLLLCLTEDERATRFRHQQRTGYAWLEFARGDDADEFLAVGCGARASTQRDAEAWFFVTSRRPEIDFELAPGGVPLSKVGLSDLLETGAVHESAEAHRLAVDRALFGLGTQRYRNLVELLLVLRRPHLAGKLNLEHLSKVLSDGLAALDEQLVADVAASFDDLEAVQRDLRRLQDADRTVRAFLPTYRRYLTATARARALAVTNAERALKAARMRVSEAEQALAAAHEEDERLRLARLECAERREIAEQRHRGVLESPAYRDAKNLVEVEARVADVTAVASRAGERLQAAEEDARRIGDDATRAENAVMAAATRVDQAFAAAGESADHAGVTWSMSRDDVEHETLQQAVRSLSAQRRQDLRDVRAALTAAAATSVRAATATSTALASAEAAQLARGRHDEAAVRLETERTRLIEAVRRWIAASGVDELDDVLVAVDLLGDPGAPSLNDVLAAALRPLRDVLAARDARAADRERALTQQHAEVTEQRRRIAADPVPAPERMSTRPATRDGRAGAALYACCDFVASVPEYERAGLEAAIEAAGLLDAWICSADGDAPSDELDAWLRPGPLAPEPTLASVLVATPPPGVDANRVRGVLASIALADAGIAVQPDGSYALGPLSGRYAKPAAEFIGTTAREQRRHRLLADLDRRLEDLTHDLATVADERRRLAARLDRLDEITATLPSARPLLTARYALVSAAATADANGRAADRDEAEVRDAREAANTAHARLRSLAHERRLATTDEGLIENEQFVHAYEQRANDLVHDVQVLTGCRATRQREAARLEEACARVANCRTEHAELNRQAVGLRARVEQLRFQLGANAAAPLQQLSRLENELRDLREEMERLVAADRAAAERRGRALHEQQLAGHDLHRQIGAMAETTARLDVVRRSDVLAVIAPAEPTAPVEPDQFAALVMRATGGAPAEPDDNALQRAFRQLLDELGRGYDPGLHYVDHVAVVEITSDTGTYSVLWLAAELAKQVARQQELLSERDREIFERHLLTRVSEALRELLNDADELVDSINRSLADRPTASGKSVQLRWEIDSADTAVKQALRLLRRTPELLGPDEREQLRRFFSTAIQQRRAEDPASGYAEILRQVLDYRSWHVFAPYVRSAGGGVQRLTRTLFRTLSGGEQAVVLHLPLFAAAAAHYDMASPGAPRLVALDEAFAGIDEGMRAELMGLLVRFDLDVVLTGHELWGAYEQVPALMVYDLLRHPPLEGVSAFAVRWDGAAMAEA